MNETVDQIAASIPKQLHDLNAAIARLRYSLDTLRAHVASIPALEVETADELQQRQPRPARTKRAARFGATAWVIEALRSGPATPAQLAAKLTAKTGRDRKTASVSVHNALARLRFQRRVVAKGGVYSVAA